jgi:peptidoglycan/xylan/chitin deacetylase (PgdA/CDA1 family)
MKSVPGLPGFPWPEAKKAAVTWSFDIDAESPVLYAEAGSGTRLATMSHQMFGPLVGVPRFLDLLARYEQHTTFFVPGFTAARYPDMVKAILDGGHEIGHHGYLHEPLRDMTAAQEADLLDRGLDALETAGAPRPRGFRAPYCELSFLTPPLLADRGFAYDSSLMDLDRPYLLDVGDTTGRTLVELPLHWSTDDWEQYNWIPGYDDGRPIETTRKVHELWAADIEAHIRYGGLFNLVNHPFVSGRAARVMAMEEMLERILADDRIWFTTLGEIANYVGTLGLSPRRHEPYS